MEKLRQLLYGVTLITLLLCILTVNGDESVDIASQVIPAVFVLGDSLVDDGNNNFISTYARANYAPYGVDFSQGPTGRFSNGKTIIDIVGDFMGKLPLPAYRDPNTSGATLLRGVNYASAAAGILDATGRHFGDRISLSQQVINLELNLQHIRNLTGDSYQKYLAKSLIVLVFGSNDYVNNYLLPTLYPTSYQYKSQDFANLLIDHYTRQILALHSIGFRKFVIPGIGPLGCIPVQLASGQAAAGSCVTTTNNMVQQFNAGLFSLVSELNNNHPGAMFLYADVYRIVADILNNYSAQGFKVRDRGCCGINNNLGQIACLPLSVPCTNRSEYVFFDAFHPSEAVNRIIAQRVFVGPPSDCYPINVSQLVMI